MTTLLDGKALGAKIREEIREAVRLKVSALQGAQTKPGLAVVVVGENPASAVYVRHKISACAEAGFNSERIALPDATSEAELLATVAQLNAAAHIHGILVQLPLPAHMNAQRVIEAIAPHKDVDGFHIHNAGSLFLNTSVTGAGGEKAAKLVPCTPLGVMKLLESANISLRCKHAVVLGASNIVGKPQAILLQAAGATVTICNSKTPDIALFTKMADVLVSAVGKPEFITGDMIKPGAVVIDVGMNRRADGSLCGDVHTASCMGIASAITPVPGGVGPMTIAMLLSNTWDAYVAK